MSRRQIAAAAMAASGVLALPAVAGAATKTVSMGEPVSAQKAFQKYGADVNDFFPEGVTIHVGDSVRFVPAGFHSVDLPPKGGKAVPLIVPTGQAISGENDAAGNPFWFNGLPGITFNPAVFTPAGGFGKSFTYDGSKRIDSAAPVGPNPQPMTVKFTKKGSFRFFCDVHHGMSGTVHVVARTAKAPSARSDAKAVAKQIARDLREAKALGKPHVPAGTVDVGSAGAHGVEVFTFFPNTLTVPVGTTVKFAMTSRSLETHTATTGPGDPNNPADANTYLGRLEASVNSPAPDAAVFFPSDAPGSPASLTASSHGNGFWNSGAMDSQGATPPPAFNVVRFDQAGTYVFHCLIHPFMHGTVVVK